MSKLTLKGGHIRCAATGTDAVQDIHIEAGHILAIGAAPKGFKADEVRNVSGHWVLPGLVDLTARLGTNPIAETRAAAKGGITTLSCPPDRQPVLDAVAAVENLIDLNEEGAATRICPTGALTTNLAGEQLADLSALIQAGCVAVGNAQAPISDLGVLRQCYQYAATFDIPLIIHPDNPTLSRGVAHDGIVSARLGLPVIPTTAETTALVHHLLLAQETGIRVHFANISCARSVDILQQSYQKDLPVTTSVSIHQLWLTEMDVADFNPMCHVRPPLRSEHEKMALIQALSDGDIHAISSDSQPQPATAKLAPFGDTAPGISGLETLLPLTHYLSETHQLDFMVLLKALTVKPAEIINQPVGTLAPGARADICVYNPTAPWMPGALESQGQNSPFLHWTLPGQVQMTFLDGRCVYSTT